MTDHGDDCYFYYYSTCTKGDTCPFRHCEAAMGTETVCTLWKEGCCFRKVCMFRHMEIKKNRKEIACYWEKQPAGCQKPHCAFYHEKARFVDGVYVPPSKGVAKVEELPHEEPTPPPAPLPTAAANPQLRGVMKAETQETVPSPTHPPVVINPADDDEDEDDQFSEEGEDGTRLTSPRKLTGGPNSHENLNFGVSTLEEIRLRKALKASMKRAGYPVQAADGTPRRNNGARGEKENFRGFGRSAGLIASDADRVALDDAERPRGSVAQRLGKKILNNDVQEQILLNRSLAARLGGVVDEADAAGLKALRPVRERLGLPVEHTDPAAQALPVADARGKGGGGAGGARKPPEQIRIKTLEEIRQEKAAKARMESSGGSSSSTSNPVSSAPTPLPQPSRGSKRAAAVKVASSSSSPAPVKTSSEALRAKRRRQQQGKEEVVEEKEEGRQERPSGHGDSKQAAGASSKPGPAAEVRVKTLEEIRREKAAREKEARATLREAQDERAAAAATSLEEAAAKKPRLLRVAKPGSPAGGAATQRPAEEAEKEKPAVKAAEPGPASSSSNGGVSVKVKSFEEIMREKRLRRQEQEERASSSGSQSPTSSSAETDGASKPTLTRKAPAAATVSTEPSDVTPPFAAAPAPKPQKKKAPLVNSLASSSASPSPGAAPTVVTTSPKKDSSPGRAKAKLRPQRGAPAAAASQGLSSQEAPAASLTKPPETKVRPKLNVKPSVVRPSERARPGQKRKVAERSAVAAVKPLSSSASSGPEEALQEPLCKHTEMFPSPQQEASVVPRSPSPLREELQKAPMLQRTAVPSTATRDVCAVPQSPAAKTPGSARPRRFSTAGARVAQAPVDDFEELMNEFNSGDQLDGDIDPGLGEDDLLQELSEMIDS